MKDDKKTPVAPPEASLVTRAFERLRKEAYNVGRGWQRLRQSPQPQVGEKNEPPKVVMLLVTIARSIPFLAGATLLVLLVARWGNWHLAHFLIAAIIVVAALATFFIGELNGPPAEDHGPDSSAPTTSPQPQPQLPPKKSRWLSAKFLVTAVAIAILALLIIPSLLAYVAKSVRDEKPVFAGYERRHCAKDVSPDASLISADRPTLELRAGCYEGPYSLPANADSFEIVRSRGVGDWVTVWCNGHVAPRKIRPHTEGLGRDFHNCFGPQDNGTPTFFIQGRGAITFRVNTYRQ